MSNNESSQFRTGSPQIALESASFATALRRFLDSSAAMKPDEKETAALIQQLNAWSDRLDCRAGTEDDSLWRKAHRNEPPALLPSLTFVEDGHRLDGTVTFGRFHVGRAAAHGGAIGMVFDEVMGALAGSGQRTRTRTAFLHVDFRALTPIDKQLRIRAWFDAESGRKRSLRAEIVDGDIVCAEAHGLWIELRPGQA